MAKILLVEDDNNLREIYGARLSAEGYDIVSAPDGEEALAIAVKEKPDLIISDIMMPKISGFDMLDILRNAPETKDTKIIMMTALSQAEDKERADKLGADLYLVKSQVTLEDVAESVRKILGDDKSQPPAAEQPADSPPAQPAEEPAPPPQPEAPAATPAEPPAPVPSPPPAPDVSAAPQTSATSPAAPSPAPAQPDNTQAPAVPSQPQNDTPVPGPSDNTSPATTPAVQAPPASTSPPSAPAVDTQQVKSEPKKIEVVLPDDDTDKPADAPTPEEKPAENAAPSTSPDAVAESLSIGPNVAEALAQEEGSTEPSKAEDKTDSTSTTSAEISATQPSTVIKPSEASAPDTSSEEPSVKQGSPNEENNPNRKVIQPLNDPTKGPDLNELLAQEEQKGISAASASPDTNPTPQPSQDTAPENPPAPGGSQDEHPDDFSKISL